MKYIFSLMSVLILLSLPVFAAEAIYIYEPDSIVIDGAEVMGEAPVAFAFSGDRPLSGGYYIDVVTDELGDLLIYVPVNWSDGYLTTTEDGNLFNLSSSTITCTAFTENGTQYTVRFSSFSQPQYRLYDYNVSTYYDLTVISIEDTNVRILDESTPMPLDSTVLSLVACVLIGGILVWVFWKL